MSRIQQLLKGRDQVLDPAVVLADQSWLLTRKMKCILSPDSDGLLCGLFMSHYLDWEVIGFYDGKVMILREGESCYHPDTAFLDMEVFRKGIRSMGHHMLLWNKRSRPSHWYERFQHCIQPNLLRDYDGSHDFRLKYPLATIHLLVGLLGDELKVEIPRSAIAPLLFTDGTFNVLYSYPENVLNWLNYLGIQRRESPLRSIFMDEHYTVYTMMLTMDDFFRQRDEISITGERGDRLRISQTDGTPCNLNAQAGDLWSLDRAARERVERFIRLLAQTTTWSYKPDRWAWDRFTRQVFTKDSFQGRGERINNRNFDRVISHNPLSWAMTSGNNIEYTLEQPSTLP
jgi:hypothetical protein